MNDGPDLNPPRHPEEEEIIFRYDRSRRLERAPESVRWMAARAGGKRPGLLSYLVATRASRMMLVTILGLALYFLIAPILGGNSARGRIGTAQFSASALFFEDRVMCVLSRNGRLAGLASDELLSVAVLRNAVLLKRVDFPLGEEARTEYRLAFESPGGKPVRVELQLSLGTRTLKLEVPVE